MSTLGTISRDRTVPDFWNRICHIDTIYWKWVVRYACVHENMKAAGGFSGHHEPSDILMIQRAHYSNSLFFVVRCVWDHCQNCTICNGYFSL